MTNPLLSSVLYIDDECSLLDLGKLYLERIGHYTVDTEMDPKMGLQRIINGLYDAVISDYQMPGMDGIELLKAIRAAGCHTPFIIFTGKGREDVVIEALNEGADFYLQKGGDPKSQFAELAKKLEFAINRRRAEDELRRKNEELAAAEEEMRSQLDALITTENRLRESRDLFRTLMDHSNDAIFIHDLDDKLLDVNETMLRMYRLTREEALTYTLRDYTGPAFNVDDIKEKWREVISGQDLLFNWQARRPTEDSVFDVEVFLTRTEVKGKMYVLAFVRDISGLLEEKATKSENTEKYRTIVENLDDIIFTLDTGGKITYLSPNVQKVIGFSVSEAKGKDLTDFASPEMKDEVLQFINRILSGEEIATEFTVRNSKGKDLWMRLNARPVKEGDEITSIHGLLTDITERKLAEDALIESERNYRALVENLMEIIYTLDTDGKVTYVTPNTETLGGYVAEEVIGKSFLEFVHPDDRKGREEEFSRLLSGRGKVSEYRMIAKDGHYVWMRTDAQPMIKDGEVVGVHGVLTDITDRKTAEQEIKLHLKRTRSLLDLYQKSEGGKQDVLDYALEGIREMTGSQYSFIGLLNDDESVLTIHAWSEEVMDACRMPRPPGVFGMEHTGLLGEVIRTRRSVIINDYSLKHPMKRGCPEGHVTIQRFLTVPIFDGGRISAILAVANKQDPYTGDDADALISLGNLAFGILDRKQTEQALRESEERFRRLAENASDIIYRIDLLPQPHFVYANPAIETVTGYSPEEFYADPKLGKQVIHPDDQLPDLAAEKEGNTYPVLRYIRKDGGIIWVEQRNVPIYDETGAIVAIEGIARDITSAKEADEKIARNAAAIADANRKLNLMTGITRHDIANQLTVLNGYLSLAEDLAGDQTLYGYLQRIEQAAERIQRQIAFTAEYQNLGIAEPGWQRLSSAIGKSHTATIPIVNETDEISIFADPLLPKVFANLLENTERYAKNVTRIRVSCHIEMADDGTFRDSKRNTHPILIIWEDDGIGIRDEEKEKIFERGYGKNTGLGLFFIREILGITGITISENGVYGEGARFVIRVPEKGWRKED